MRQHGWTWTELQETPENVLRFLALIDEWEGKKAEADR